MCTISGFVAFQVIFYAYIGTVYYNTNTDNKLADVCSVLIMCVCTSDVHAVNTVCVHTTYYTLDIVHPSFQVTPSHPYMHLTIL